MSELRFHVYALCFNESRLLPYFFHHYREAEQIFIVDNDSTDNSVEIVKKYNRTVIPFHTDHKFDDTTHQKIKNEVWKQSRGKCDYIIVQDLDEFLFFPSSPYSVKQSLFEYKKQNIYWIQCVGYEMYCSDNDFSRIPDNRHIIEYVQQGFKNSNEYNKPLVFSPDHISETRFFPGQHDWSPVASPSLTQHFVKGIKNNPDALLLHFKHMGKEWELSRRIVMRDRMSDLNKKKGFGHEYMITDDKLKEYIEIGHKKAVSLTNLLIHVPMITTEIRGGLGNQLFIVASTLSYAYQNGYVPFFHNHTYGCHSSNGYRENILSKIPFQDKILSDSFLRYNESLEQIYSPIPPTNSNLFLFGYFQTSKYFSNMKSHLQSLFVSTNKMSREFLSNLKTKFPNSKLIGVHVCRGDYISLRWELPISYYNRAMMEMKTKFPNALFVIFSDDMPWCRTNFPSSCIFSEFKDDVVEFDILRNMDGWIIANSSFSWWASYLGDSENNMETIAPYFWFPRNGIHKFNEHIYESHWKKIDPIETGVKKIEETTIETGVKKTDRYTFISNNCFGASVYKHFNRQYDNPFIGSYIQDDFQFVKLCSNFSSYMDMVPTFGAGKLPFDSQGIIKIGSFPNMFLGDIEINWIHEKSEKICLEKYLRRKERMKGKTPFFVFGDSLMHQNHSNEERESLIQSFLKISASQRIYIRKENVSEFREKSFDDRNPGNGHAKPVSWHMNEPCIAKTIEYINLFL